MIAGCSCDLSFLLFLFEVRHVFQPSVILLTHTRTMTGATDCRRTRPSQKCLNAFRETSSGRLNDLIGLFLRREDAWHRIVQWSVRCCFVHQLSLTTCAPHLHTHNHSSVRMIVFPILVLIPVQWMTRRIVMFGWMFTWIGKRIFNHMLIKNYLWLMILTTRHVCLSVPVFWYMTTWKWSENLFLF